MSDAAAMQSDPAAMRSRLADIIKEKSVRYGEFTLTSGKTSKYFIDGKLTVMDPEGAWLTARLMLDVLAEFDVAAVGGPTLGADPIAGAIAAVGHQQGVNLPAYIVRKEKKGHGTQKQVEGPAIASGSRVAMVEDVVSSGGSALRAVDALESETGAEVVVLTCLVDRAMGADQAFARRDIAYRPLFQRHEVVDESRI